MIDEVLFDFIFDVLSIDWNAMCLEFPELNIYKEVEELGDVDEEYVTFFLSNYSVVALGNTLMAVSSPLYVVKVFEKLLVTKDLSRIKVANFVHAFFLCFYDLPLLLLREFVFILNFNDCLH